MDRDQEFLMPPSLREWLPDDHLVWFVLDVVEQLDTTAFHAHYRLGGRGRPPFDPDVLLAVLIYAYAVGERSSRRIEALCHEHVAFQVACGRDVPDHTVISRFRAAHEDRFAEVFAQVLQMCTQAGMVRVGTVAIDGTVIAADASIFANRAEESLRNEADRIAAQIAAQVVAEAAAVDDAEDAEHGDARGDELAPEFANPATRAAAIKAALTELEAEKKRRAQEAAQESERRAEVWQARAEQARAGLAALEADLAARAAAWDAARDGTGPVSSGTPSQPRRPGRRPDPDNATVRRRRARVLQLEQRAAAARAPKPGAGTGDDEKRRRVNVTDPQSRIMNTRQGWVQGYNAQLAVTDDHLILALMLTQSTDMACLVPMMNTATSTAEDLVEHRPDADPTAQASQVGVVLADAGYCSEDNLTAAGPDRLIATGKDRKMVAEAAEDPRHGPPSAATTAVQAMRHRTRTPQGLATYRRRGALVEPVNAHIKDQVGLRRFSRRGLAAATSELNLAAAVVNLLKLRSHTAIA